MNLWSDRELLSMVADGYSKPFKQRFMQHYQKMAAFLYRLICDRCLAEELEQDIL